MLFDMNMKMVGMKGWSQKLTVNRQLVVAYTRPGRLGSSRPALGKWKTKDTIGMPYFFVLLAIPPSSLTLLVFCFCCCYAKAPSTHDSIHEFVKRKSEFPP